MSNEKRVIEILADGEFHSGELIAKEMGVSRAMIWKSIQAIRKNQKLQIISVKGRGYKLQQPLELLDEEAILNALPSATKDSLQFHIQNSISSTNSWLMERAVESIPSGTLCIAEQQTSGRGRYGREWVSPYGKNIYLSLLWRYLLSPSDISGLSLAAGVVILRVLRQLGLKDAGLKWPNDIFWQEKKLAGLLLEVAGESTGPCHVVIGIGINVYIDDQAAAKIDQPWVDLATIKDFKEVSRNQLVAMILDALLVCLQRYEKEGLEPYLADWESFDLHYGKKVCLKSGNSEIVGIHQGIDKYGGLRLNVAGKIRSYHAGEVSLRSL